MRSISPSAHVGVGSHRIAGRLGWAHSAHGLPVFWLVLALSSCRPRRVAYGAARRSALKQGVGDYAARPGNGAMADVSTPTSTAFQRFYADNGWLICVDLQKSHRISVVSSSIWRRAWFSARAAGPTMDSICTQCE